MSLLTIQENAAKIAIFKHFCKLFFFTLILIQDATMKTFLFNFNLY